MIEFIVTEAKAKLRDEQYKRGRFNYTKANFEYLRKFFENAE